MNAAAAALVVLNGRQAFDPRASLFAHNEPGFWYDPSDLSSMYQDSAGTTPVTAVEQAVGLILDKIRGLVLGPELVTNGDFSSGSTGWITTTTGGNAITISGGSARIQATGADTCQLAQNNVFTAGKFYRVEFDVLVGSSGTLKITPVGGAAGEIVFSCTPGRKTFTTLVSSGTQLVFNRVAGQVADAYIDNISVRELAGNHAIQPTSASRPTLRARYNLLTYSEQFDNAAWTKLNTTVTANSTQAPDGTTTADTLVETAASGVHRVSQSFTPPVTGSHTTSIYAKASTRSWLVIQNDFGANNTQQWFDLALGSVGGQAGAGGTASITLIGNGWYRCTLTTVATTTGAGNVNIYVTDANNNSSYLGDGTSGIFIWGADLRRSNDTYLPYQRIAAATDYDTVGFPPYLAFDGSDDSLYTGGSIDFSATDKMTVFAGVTKLSDAATAMVAELSATVTGNNGSFYLIDPRSGANSNLQFAAKGTLDTTVDAAGAAPVTRVVAATADISGDLTTLRVDGVASSPSTADLGTGNFGSYPLYIGRRNNASLPFNGRVYALIGRGAATSAALIQQAERWVAGKQGRTL